MSLGQIGDRDFDVALCWIAKPAIDFENVDPAFYTAAAGMEAAIFYKDNKALATTMVVEMKGYVLTDLAACGDLVYDITVVHENGTNMISYMT